MTEALIQPATLKAARERAGLTVEDLAAKVARKPEQLRDWERGEERPSFAQARKLADVLRVPFAALFLPAKSIAPAALPDLRTRGARPSTFSLELVDVYHDALRKQEWVREIRERDGHEPVGVVGAARGRGDDVAAGAAALRECLRLEPDDRIEARTTDDYFRLLIRRAEEAGILVLRGATVGANTHRKLRVDEFRGFAIADRYAPLVFVNTADWKAAQIFTLAHELAHLWRAETGISQPTLEAPRRAGHDAEAVCDQIAAELLVPRSEIEDTWDDGEDLDANGEALRKHFKVSGMVVARRALDLGLTTRTEYREYMAKQVALAKTRPAQKEIKLSPLTMIPFRNGMTVTDLVTRELRRGRLLWRDAGRLLGASAPVLARLTNPREAAQREAG